MAYFQSTSWGREPSNNVNGATAMPESRDEDLEEGEGLDTESRLKRIESTDPDIAAILRNQQAVLQKQHEQMARLRTDMMDQFRMLQEQLNPSLRAQEAMYGIRSIVAHYDRRQNNTSSTPMTNGRKRLNSPPNNYVYPASQRLKKTTSTAPQAHVYDDSTPAAAASSNYAAPLVDYQAPYAAQSAYASFAHEAHNAAAGAVQQANQSTPSRNNGTTTTTTTTQRPRPDDPDPPPPFLSLIHI